jgi:predicted nicotinamide N-methyase
MIRFAVGFFVGLSCAGWVAAHPAAAHAVAVIEHAAGLALVKLAEAIGGR